MVNARSRLFAKCSAFVVVAIVAVAFNVRSALGDANYAVRRVDISMRDGVRLHTIVLIPNGAKDFPILVNRTPFGAERRLHLGARLLRDAVPPVEQAAAKQGYIFAFQDVRGKFGSEGRYVISRPLSGALNPTPVDHATDAWDTIDWLVHNIPGSNGRVGVIGTSYDGFTALMALVHPHPALHAAVIINPFVDGWKGDDWFENGAFRQVMLPFLKFDGGLTDDQLHWPSGTDDYNVMLRYGSTGAFATAAGLDALPYWKTIKSHAAYDGFWQDQALDRILTTETKAVPTLFVHSLWDQEDIYGAIHAWRAAAEKSPNETFLVIGPWAHGQANRHGKQLGPLNFGNDTSEAFRARMLQPFLDCHLKRACGAPILAPVTAFETGTNRWRVYPTWPPERASPVEKTVFLRSGGELAYAAPTRADAPANRYSSDPAHPVPFAARPVKIVTDIDEQWETWMVEDQRSYSARPDVLTYTSTPLASALAIAGEPSVRLYVSTTGSDADWVVKLIDVYPSFPAVEKALSGYELPLSMAIYRARYRNDPAAAVPMVPGTVYEIRFSLPDVHHVLLPGHRLAIQIQSSWFPLYDRNPQTFVANIFDARPSDYRAVTQTVLHTPTQASAIILPLGKP